MRKHFEILIIVYNYLRFLHPPNWLLKLIFANSYEQKNHMAIMCPVAQISW